MNAFPLLYCLVLASTLLASPSPPQQPPRDIPDHGRQPLPLPADLTPPASVKRADDVPYELTPDWTNDLRRQVGGIQAADMNGDDLIDVVVGCYISDSYPPYEHWFNYIYYNIGGKLESQPSWISDDEVSTGDVQVALINDDDYPDIFAANGGFAMSPSVIYFGAPGGPNTTPGWQSAEPMPTWNNYALPFDIDHDGDVDVITANQGVYPDSYRPIYVFRNHDGSLDTTPSWQSAESSIQGFLAIADYDGDGWEDLAVSKWVNFQSAVYKNIAGTFQTVPVWTTGNEGDDKGVAWADIDANGWPDLILGHDPTQLYANKAGTLTMTWQASGTYFGHSDLRAHDIDGDGDNDLAEIHFANGHVNIYVNRDGALDAEPAWIYDSPHVGTAIAFGDITGNGRPDLIVGNSGDTSLMVFYAADFDCPADITGDGVVDVLDLLQLLDDWGEAASPADINHDGIVDVLDLLLLLDAWGPC